MFSYCILYIVFSLSFPHCFILQFLCSHQDLAQDRVTFSCRFAHQAAVISFCEIHVRVFGIPHWVIEKTQIPCDLPVVARRQEQRAGRQAAQSCSRSALGVCPCLLERALQYGDFMLGLRSPREMHKLAWLGRTSGDLPRPRFAEVPVVLPDLPTEEIWQAGLSLPAVEQESPAQRYRPSFQGSCRGPRPSPPQRGVRDNRQHSFLFCMEKMCKKQCNARWHWSLYSPHYTGQSFPRPLSEPPWRRDFFTTWHM